MSSSSRWHQGSCRGPQDVGARALALLPKPLAAQARHWHKVAHNLWHIAPCSLCLPSQKKASGIQLPVPNPPLGWCTFALDMVAALKRNTSSPFVALRSIQLCSKLSARGVFTSDIRFSAQVSCILPESCMGSCSCYNVWHLAL